VGLFLDGEPRYRDWPSKVNDVLRQDASPSPNEARDETAIGILVLRFLDHSV